MDYRAISAAATWNQYNAVFLDDRLWNNRPSVSKDQVLAEYTARKGDSYDVDLAAGLWAVYKDQFNNLAGSNNALTRGALQDALNHYVVPPKKAPSKKVDFKSDVAPINGPGTPPPPPPPGSPGGSGKSSGGSGLGSIGTFAPRGTIVPSGGH